MWLPESWRTASKWLKLGVLAFVISGVSLAVYTGVRTHYGRKSAEQAERYKQEQATALAERDRYRALASQKEEALQKANAKVEKLQVALAKIKIPPPATPPESLGQTILDLRTMGMELVLKPSLMVAPSVAGITQNDAKLAWSWGNEARRIPYFESKIEKYGELTKALEKAKATAEGLADLKGKEADAAGVALDKANQRAEAEARAREQIQKAIKAERAKKYLYAVGGVAAGAAVTKALH